MTLLERHPVTLSVPLREEPPGVLRVGKSRVLLELVIRAHLRGTPPHEIVRMYDSLELGDVYAVIAYYLAHRTAVDEYLRHCDEEAEAIRRKLEREQQPGPTKEELLREPVPRGSTCDPRMGGRAGQGPPDSRPPDDPGVRSRTSLRWPAHAGRLPGWRRYAGRRGDR